MDWFKMVQTPSDENTCLATKLGSQNKYMTVMALPKLLQC